MKRILLVDDHEVVRRGLRHILKDGLPSAQVIEAGTAEAAVAAIAAGGLDLVLLDIGIPGRSGLEVLTEARRLQPRLPVLILSVHAEEQYAVRCMKLGAAGYLRKDAAGEELLAAVHKVLAGGRYISAALAEQLASAVSADVEQPPHELLSVRELQVLRLLAQGRTQKEAAADLHLSEKTVATYRARIAQKLRLSSNNELTRYALRHGLVDG